MLYIHFHQTIIQSMFHLNELSHLDIVWFSRNYSEEYSFISHSIPSAIDFNIAKEFPLIEEKIFNADGLTYCCAATHGFLEFIFIPLMYEDVKEGFIRIGPFLSTVLPETQISQLFHALKLSVRDQQHLRHYYEALPLLASNNNANLGYLGMNLFGQSMPIVRESHYQSEHSAIISNDIHTSTTENIALIEERYKHEHLLRQAFRENNRALLDSVIQYFETSANFRDRVPKNPLRSTKNLAFAYNTVLRHASEDAGLHPVYLDRLSFKYALLIEQSTTRTQVLQLHREMFNGYFDAVSKYVFKQYSPFVQRVIHYIQLNIDKALTPSHLAKHFYVQASNLSTLFKKETGKTISTFVHELQIAEACYYLETTTLTVSEISTMLGINDANYFTRLFKKIKKMPPSVYRKGHFKY